MEKTFLFYDIETSGLNVAFDQILSFAYIRTRLDLTPLDRNSFCVNLRKDVIPSAGAFLTHQLTLDELNKGLCEYNAAQRIHSIVNQPGTISLGYNTMGFDDEFLRFTFYRNLLDSYTHQYSNGCSRMDIFPVTTLYRVFNPNIMSWPQKEGKNSLKLEDISTENRFLTSGRAHEAMSDVEATIELAKRLRSDEKMWAYCTGFFDKSEDQSRISKFENQWLPDTCGFRVGIMVSSSFGSDANYLAPVLYIGESRSYPNQHLWIPLDKKLCLEEGDTISNVFVVRKRYGDQNIILPALKRFWEKLAPDSRKTASDNLIAIKASAGSFNSLVSEHLDFKYPDIPDIDPDAALYQNGFFNLKEKKEIARFHQADIDEKIKLSETFSSERVKILARRIVSRNFFAKAHSSNDEYEKYRNKVYSSTGDDVIKGYRNDVKLNKIEGLREISEKKKMLTNSDTKKITILEALEAHIRHQ